jgi:hypothetical protein
LEEIVSALLRLRQKLFPLNPLSVTSTDAASCFRSQQRANARLFEALSPVIEAASTVFDVGANAGFCTKGLLSRFPNFNGRVVLFEPVAHLIEIAAAVLAGRANLEFENTALGDMTAISNCISPSMGTLGGSPPCVPLRRGDSIKRGLALSLVTPSRDRAVGLINVGSLFDSYEVLAKRDSR